MKKKYTINAWKDFLNSVRSAENIPKNEIVLSIVKEMHYEGENLSQMFYPPARAVFNLNVEKVELLYPHLDKMSLRLISKFTIAGPLNRFDRMITYKFLELWVNCTLYRFFCAYEYNGGPIGEMRFLKKF